MSELSIDSKKTALVVIDLQKGIVGRETAPYSAASVVDNASHIADAFRAKKMPVFLVRVSMSEDGKDRLNPVTDDQMMGMGSLPSDWAEIVPKMGPKKDDFVITKHQWGAFYGTELDLLLRRRGIDTIVLCGISTILGLKVPQDLPMNLVTTKYLLKMPWQPYLMKNITSQLLRLYLAWAG